MLAADSPSRQFEQATTQAKQRLPKAFAVGGPLPFSSEVRLLPTKYPRRPNAVGLEVDDDLLPTGEENVNDFEEANRELGFDAIAFYRSFHRPTPAGQWGIFYWDHRVRQFAEEIRRKLCPTDRKNALSLTMEILRRHELFHFRFDVYALHQELTTARPLYNHYSRNVYAKVLCTDQCYEEALANRACVSRGGMARGRRHAVSDHQRC